ncbi:MAG: hypothetical protein JRJ15_16580 [Deltaproteobacteria bacterium]|nr:hypothetical protein [Deltaproteobacteria bacterium]
MNKLKKKDWASRLAIFKDLDEKQIKTLYSLSTIKKLQPGDLLFKEGAIDQRHRLSLMNPQMLWP